MFPPYPWLLFQLACWEEEEMPNKFEMQGETFDE